jgi:hypothetical protein
MPDLSGSTMAHVPTKNDDQYSDKETAQRRDAVIKRMLATPPKPHSEMKIGKPKAKPKKIKKS